MDGSSDPIPSRFRGQLLNAMLPAILFAFLAVALGSVQGMTTTMIGPVSVHVQPALFVIAGLVGGPAAVVGALAGYAVSVSGVFPSGSVALFGYAYLGLSAYVLRDYLWEMAAGTRGRWRAGGKMVAALAVVPTVGAAVLTGWGYELLGQFHFFPYAALTVLSLTASILLYAGPVIVLLSVRKPDWLGSGLGKRLQSDPRQDSSSGRMYQLSVLPVAWLVFGSILSAGLQVGELLPVWILRQNGLQPLHLVREFALQGVGGSTIQIGLGVFMFVLWTSTIRHGRVDT